MSSGFLAQAAQKYAKKNDINMRFHAKSESVVEDVIADYQLLLIGPHYRNHLEEFTEMAEPYDIPVDVVPDEVYGSLDGEGLVKFAMEKLAN